MPAAAFAWSKLIDAETLETEIKRLAQAVAQDVTSPSEFKGGAYQACRRHFSVLATLFAIAAEYDGEVRWQDAAAGAARLVCAGRLQLQGRHRSNVSRSRNSANRIWPIW